MNFKERYICEIEERKEDKIAIINILDRTEERAKKIDLKEIIDYKKGMEKALKRTLQPLLIGSPVYSFIIDLELLEFIKKYKHYFSLGSDKDKDYRYLRVSIEANKKFSLSMHELAIMYFELGLKENDDIKEAENIRKEITNSKQLSKLEYNKNELSFDVDHLCVPRFQNGNILLNQHDNTINNLGFIRIVENQNKSKMIDKNFQVFATYDKENSTVKFTLFSYYHSFLVDFDDINTITFEYLIPKLDKEDIVNTSRRRAEAVSKIIERYNNVQDFISFVDEEFKNCIRYKTAGLPFDYIDREPQRAIHLF